jgi:uncharacterized OB-fold protein
MHSERNGEQVTPVLAPQPTTDDRHFWEGIAAGQVLLQRCSDCQTMRHPPRPMCGKCNSLRWETFPSTLKGTVISWIIPRHPPVLPGEEQLIGIVETDEGARLVLNLHGFASGGPVANHINGARVDIFMLDVGDGVVLPQARLASR